MLVKSSKMKMCLIFIIFVSLISMNEAFDCQSDDKCKCKIVNNEVFEIKCKNGTVKVLHGETVKEIKFFNLKEPITNADLIIYSNLSAVNISDNLISEVPQNLLQGLNDLNVFSLTNTSMKISPGFFQYTNKIKYIRIDNSNISILEPGIFDNLKDLEYLSLSGNNLKSFEPEIFKDLVKLTELDLSRNQISTFTLNQLAGLRALRILNLSDNRFTILNYGVSNYSKDDYPGENIEELILSNNKITKIEESFYQNLPKKLKKLRIDKNPLVCDCLLFDFVENNLEIDGLRRVSCHGLSGYIIGYGRHQFCKPEASQILTGLLITFGVAIITAIVLGIAALIRKKYITVTNSYGSYK